LDGPERLGRVGEGGPHGLGDLFEWHFQVPVVVQVADDVFGDRMKAGRQEDARVPRQVLRQGLLRFGTHDRVELVFFLVTLQQARALEGFGLDILAALVRAASDPETVDAHPTGERLPAQRADLHFLQIEGWIFRELLIDHVLELEAAATPLLLYQFVDPAFAAGRALWEWTAAGGPTIQASYRLDGIGAVGIAATCGYAAAGLLASARSAASPRYLPSLVLAIGFVSIAVVVPNDLVAAVVALAVLAALTAFATLLVAPAPSAMRLAAYLTAGLLCFVV